MFSKLAPARGAALAAVIVFLASIVIFRSGSVSQANSETAVLPPNLSTSSKAVVDIAGTVDGNADPGDTLEYTVTIPNTGPDPALNVVVTDTLLGPQTLVAGSFLVSPIAANDTFASIGNVGIAVPDGASDLLSNDINANNPADTAALVFTQINAAAFVSGSPVATTSGTVTVNANGSFSYISNPGFEGADSFTYTLGNGTGLTNTATVTINVSGMIWFVQTGAAAGGNGRLATPFNCFVGVNCFDDTVLDEAGDNIFLYSGAYTGGQTLLNNQRLIGQGATAALAGAGSITGITIPPFSNALPATGGARPTMTTTAAATSALTLGSGNTLRGFNIGNTTAIDITGTSFGTLTALEMDLNGTGRPLNLTTGTLAATFDTLTSTNAAGGAGVSLTTVGGALTVTGTTSITTAGAQGINMSGSAVVANFGTSTTITDPVTQGILVGTQTGNVSLGNTTVSDATDAISLQNNSAGTRSFGTITTTNGTGDSFVHAAGGGITTVSGLATLTNPGSNCIDIQDSTTAVTFANVNCTASAAAGVFLDDNSGAVTFADLDIDTDANVRAFQATAGNTGTITTTSGTIADTGTAIAVDIAGTSAASRTPLNVQFTEIDSTGAASGIILTNTSSAGSPGGFRVLGTGGSCTSAATCTGGAIQTSTGHGIDLNTVVNVVLNSVFITGSADSGINGATVNGFVVNSSRIVSNGNNAATDDCGVELVDLVGSVSGGANPTSITNTTISNNFEFELQITNTTATALTNLQMSGNTISSNTAVAGHGNLFNFLGLGTANMTLNMTSGTFTGNAPFTATGTQCDHSGTSGTMICNISGTTYTNNNVGPQASVAGGAQVIFDFNGNTATGNRSHGINLFADANPPFTKSLTGRIRNNIVGTFGVAGSGSDVGFPIRVQNEGRIPMTLAITGNTVQESTNFTGININVGITTVAGSATTNATITGNTIREIDSGRAIAVQQNDHLPAGGNAGTVCTDISGNVISNVAGQAGDGTFLRLRRSESSVTKVFNVRQLQATTAVNVSEVDDANGFNDNPAGSRVSVGGFPTYNAGACTQPPIPPPAQEEAANINFGSDNNLSFLNASYQSPWNSSEFGVQSSEFAVVTGGNATVMERASSLGEKQAEENTKTDTSSFLTELVGKLSEIISPTVYAQDKKPPEGGTPNAPNAPETGETVTSQAFTLPAGETVTVKFRATVDNGPYASGLNTITNTANITATGGVNVNTPASSINLDAAPDLVVTKTEGGGTTQPGVLLVYTLSYSNTTANNGQHAANVVLTETVPANTTFNAGASTAGWTGCANGAAAGSICTFNVAGTVNAGAAAVNVNFAVNVLAALPAGVIQVSNTSSIAENPNVNGTDRVPANNTGPDTTNIIGNWLGGTSTDWFTAANWSNGVIPPTGNNVSVPNVANQPIVTTADVTLNNMTLIGENVTINAGRTISVNGLAAIGTNFVNGAGTLALGPVATITRTLPGQVETTLVKTFAGPGAFTYPVGTSAPTASSPLAVNVTAGAGSLAVKANAGTAPATPALVDATTLDRYWALTETGALTVDLLFTYLQTDVDGNENAYRLLRVNDLGTAAGFPNGPPCPGAGSPCVDPGANTIKANGVQVFSVWTAGEAAPTAANAQVTGRVLTSDGRGLAGSIVSIADSSGNVRYAMTNPFGYYRFIDIRAGESYVMSVRDKRFTFASRVVNVTDSLAEVNFVPEE